MDKIMSTKKASEVNSCGSCPHDGASLKRWPVTSDMNSDSIIALQWIARMEQSRFNLLSSLAAGGTSGLAAFQLGFM